MTPPAEGTFLLLNKPLGWSSFDVVRKVRNATGEKVGHAGTLDPLASGLLILALGKATRKIDEVQGLPKRYIGSFCLGATTESYDLEQPIIPWPEPFEIPTLDRIRSAAEALTGDILQRPPEHSAIKIGGKRSYRLARAGREVTLEARPVTVRQFDITAYAWPLVHFEILCSKGTYIRALARDFGEALGAGGFMSSLCRTAIGHFQLRDALTPERAIVCNRDHPSTMDS